MNNSKSNKETRKSKAPKTAKGNKPLKVSEKQTKSRNKQPFDFWHGPALITPNRFKFKSLSCWSCNISVGCSHACRFCYVPSASTNWQATPLKKYGVKDPDAEWGDYSLLRPWDEKKFMASLKIAEKVPVEELNSDGNRAIIFCSTTDPFQIFRGSTPETTRLLNTSAKALVRKALEAIRDHSTLNVRILTRSPLARDFFDVFKTFGDRLVFGMSVPTTDDRLAKVYEPRAPAPARRLETLKAAREAGLNVYVAVAPIYPEIDADDLKRTLTVIKEFDPITVFGEPINIRAENVERIAKHAESLGVKLKTEVFKNLLSWRSYALETLIMLEQLAREVGLLHCLHLWPDKQLGNRNYYLQIRELHRISKTLTPYEKQKYKEQDLISYDKQFRPWLDAWWTRISDWPGAERNRRVATLPTA